MGKRENSVSHLPRLQIHYQSEIKVQIHFQSLMGGSDLSTPLHT